MTRIYRDHNYDQPVIFSGAEISKAKAGMIMIHGRGADAENILTLSGVLDVENFVYAAPQAKNNSWYPLSFLAPLQDNEPYITSGLNIITSTLNYLNERRIATERIFLLGFSQGACLVLEYCSRYPRKFGGIVGLSGGLIGPAGLSRKISGSLKRTKIFLGCGDVDTHIPVERVDFTEEYLRRMDGEVIKKIYQGMGHTVNNDEIENVKELMSDLKQ